MSSTQLTFEEQLAIDMEVHRIAHATHYELLGLFQGADRASVQRAFRERSERLSPEFFGGRDLGDYLPRLERVREALIQARDTLADPERRARYDETIMEQKRASLPPNAIEDSWDFDEVKPPSSSNLSTLSIVPGPPSSPPAPPSSPPPLSKNTPSNTMMVGRVQLAQVASTRPVAAPTTPAPTPAPAPAAAPPTRPTRPLGAAPAPPQERPSSAPRVSPNARTAVGPSVPPLARPPSRPSAPAPEPPAVVAPPPVAVAAPPVPVAPPSMPAASRAPVVPQIDLREWVSRDDFNVLQAEMGSVLQEINTLCRAVEYCLGIAEPGESPRRVAMAHTRGAIAALRARRAEREEEWAVALENWERAILADPTEARYHAHIADVILRMDGDIDMAESHARRAVELNPDMAYAQSTLAVVLSRRDF